MSELKAFGRRYRQYSATQEKCLPNRNHRRDLAPAAASRSCIRKAAFHGDHTFRKLRRPALEKTRTGRTNERNRPTRISGRLHAVGPRRPLLAVKDATASALHGDGKSPGNQAHARGLTTVNRLTGAWSSCRRLDSLWDQHSERLMYANSRRDGGTQDLLGFLFSTPERTQQLPSFSGVGSANLTSRLPDERG